MIAEEGVQIIFQPLMSTTGTVGERIVSITLGATNAVTLITGIIILLAHSIKSR